MRNFTASMLTQQSVLPKFPVWNVLHPSAPLQHLNILVLFLGSGTSRPASSRPHYGHGVFSGLNSMKSLKYWMVVPTALAMLLSSAGLAGSTPIQIAPGFQPDPLVVNGTSGGSIASQSCGKIAEKPNHVLTLNGNFNYLRINVQSSGQPTLLIKGPSGTSCVPADSLSGGNIQSPGYWEQGTYSIYVGDMAGGQNPYTLSLTQKP